MTKERSENDLLAVASKRRFTFSLKLLLVITAVIAVVAAFATHHPLLAAVLAAFFAFVACLKMFVHFMEIIAERIGRSPHSRISAIILVSTAASSWGWVVANGLGPVVFIALVSTLLGLMVCVVGLSGDR